jgi:hypothetical protein
MEVRKETTMIDKLLLALRNRGHRITVIKDGDSQRPQLGVAHPQEEDRRAAALKQWGIDPAAPRSERPATIDEPLPQRAQTILSYRLDPALRRRLDSSMGPPAGSRPRSQQGAAEEAGVRIEPGEQ